MTSSASLASNLLLQQQDSLLTAEPLSAAETDSLVADTTAVSTHSRPLTPHDVLRMLPPNATPAQQDSAIQAWFQPGEIHYSDRPDTLHLPGHTLGPTIEELGQPENFLNGFFYKSEELQAGITSIRSGVAGDPVPYTIKGDNLFTSLLLLIFVVLVVALAHTKRFIARQAKDLIFPTYHDDHTETSGELRFQLLLVALLCLQLAISAYLYTDYYIADTFILNDESLLVALLFACFVGYFGVKWLLQSSVNLIFFGGKKNIQWMRIQLFLTASSGVLLFPAVLLQVYFDFSLTNTAYYFAFVLILTKIITFYKCKAIFFRQNGGFMQTFLYFCALEIVPIFSLVEGLVLMVNTLKVNI